VRPRHSVAAYFLRRRSMATVKPILQALVLAEHIYDDRGTGKKVIAGTFNQVLMHAPLVEEEPPDSGAAAIVHGGRQGGSPYAYISITEIHTAADLVLRFVDLADNPPIVLFETQVRVETPDPLQTIELVAALPLLPIQHEGAFALEILCENELLGSFRIVARRFSQPTG
jgi:hypothetical protein